ncbi:hypothetical protein KEM60_03033 [Austwickia sp. TVS 96-490-7B]|nr:hypothetical protein [Austwickia sp. TVS 96-490-7B]
MVPAGAVDLVGILHEKGSEFPGSSADLLNWTPQ